VDKKTTHCKAIAKSTGKPCKRLPVKNGLCRYHLPRELQMEDESTQSSGNIEKNNSLGNAFLNQPVTTRQKNRFIRVIVVSTRRKKK
tara:strand:+ start:673 stop:933 length:261 start_codon:yes stop_codon:yes gene_type:complete